MIDDMLSRECQAYMRVGGVSAFRISEGRGGAGASVTRDTITW